MLRLLGAIYYALALLGLIAIFNGFNNHYAGLSLIAGGGFVLASAFFGAICWVADDIRSLLRTWVAFAVPNPAAASLPPEEEAPSAAQQTSPPAPAEVVPAATIAEPQPVEPASIEPAQTVAREPEPAEIELSLENASEDELMAEYDIVKPGDHFLAYGRVKFETLPEAIAYVKDTRR